MSFSPSQQLQSRTSDPDMHVLCGAASALNPKPDTHFTASEKLKESQESLMEISSPPLL
jgi:hypothetical protein